MADGYTRGTRTWIAGNNTRPSPLALDRKKQAEGKSSHNDVRNTPPNFVMAISPHTSKKRLSGWGGRDARVCVTAQPSSPSAVEGIVRRPDFRPLIARGLGRAYGDAATCADGFVLSMTEVDCLASFDESTGRLRCEAGVSFASIIDAFLPRGWFLPTTPGTKFITVGGAIAADIHGKNHHRVGSFGEFVDEFHLLLASGCVVRCSRDENAELFYASLGGMGLTGVILDATFRLVPTETAWVTVDYRKTQNLDHTLETFAAGDASHEHSVAWVDCLAGGESLGRGVVMQGNPAKLEDLAPDRQSRPLALPTKLPTNVPFTPPFTLLNRLTVRGFNGVFYWKHANTRKVVDINTFFYPLDSVGHWNRLYGPRGFVQYQAFFPSATSHAGLRSLLGRIVESGAASFLAVLKSCGKADGGLLSYLEPGHTLALDFPYDPKATPSLCRDLDKILLEYSGRLYLAKDSMAAADTIRAMYPRLPDFMRIKREIDPTGRFASGLARRLGLEARGDVSR